MESGGFICRTLSHHVWVIIRIFITDPRPYLNSCTLLYPTCDTNTRFVCQRSLGAVGSFGKDMQSRIPADLSEKISERFWPGSDYVHWTSFVIKRQPTDGAINNGMRKMRRREIARLINNLFLCYVYFRLVSWFLYEYIRLDPSAEFWPYYRNYCRRFWLVEFFWRIKIRRIIRGLRAPAEGSRCAWGGDMET